MLPKNYKPRMGSLQRKYTPSYMGVSKRIAPYDNMVHGKHNKYQIGQENKRTPQKEKDNTGATCGIDEDELQIHPAH